MRPDTERMAEEFETIQEASPDKKFHADFAHQWIKDHPDCVAYGRLEWDDTIGGYQYRLQQIRALYKEVEIVYKEREPTKEFVATIVVREKEDGSKSYAYDGYGKVDTENDPEELDAIFGRILRDFHGRLKNKPLLEEKIPDAAKLHRMIIQMMRKYSPE